MGGKGGQKITFALLAYLYVGNSVTVKTTLTDTNAVTYKLARDGEGITIPLDDSGGTPTFDGVGPMFSPLPSRTSWAGREGCFFLSGQKDRQKLRTCIHNRRMPDGRGFFSDSPRDVLRAVAR